MDLNNLISLKIVIFLLAVIIGKTSGQICRAQSTVEIPENNKVGDLITEITIQTGVSLEITDNPQNASKLSGNRLETNKVLDYEMLPDVTLIVSILCTKDGEIPLQIKIYVIVINLNDNSPVFDQNSYNLEVNELSKVGTTVGKVEAKDLDGDQLYYKLECPNDEFTLKTPSNPEIIVNKVLNYDTTKEITMTLYVQDTPLSSTVTSPHNDTTTVIVKVLDINNRPPWFQPCKESTVGTVTLCITSGYTGNIKIHEQVAGELTLKPGPVHAIDGDKGRNEPIKYAIIEGNVDNTFIINENTGSITMQKSVGTAGNIILTVMAYEQVSPDQAATTTVTLQVVVTNSKFPPKFDKTNYEGFISEDAGVDSLVLESKAGTTPLRVQATDEDFSDGVNPNITFEVSADSHFKITPEGFIIMTRAASPGPLDLQITVVDTTTGEFSHASLSVEVTPGVTTTDMPTTTPKLNTTAMTTSMVTSSQITTNMVTDPTTVTGTQLTESTSSPQTITTNPDTTRSPYTEGLPLPLGQFQTEDMIALGVSLAIVLLICFVVIGVLAYNLSRFNTNWKKLSEASIFRSTLSGSSGGPKDGVQYTNEGFQSDGDTDSVTSKQAAELVLPQGPKPSHGVADVLKTQRSAPAEQSKTNHDNGSLPTDSSSLNTSDSTDLEKEVKPILTKERRMEDGYKAVWFKEDIDPNDKDEVVITDRNEDVDNEDYDHDDDEEDEGEEEEEEDEDEASNSAL